MIAMNLLMTALTRAATFALVLIEGCALVPDRQPGAVQRIYVLNCGESKVDDVSPRWSPGINVGKPGEFSANCYLINYNREQSVQSMEKAAALIEKNQAQLWINHDKAQSDALPKAPAYIE
jgi:hypothetical protein